MLDTASIPRLGIYALEDLLTDPLLALICLGLTALGCMLTGAVGLGRKGARKPTSIGLIAFGVVVLGVLAGIVLTSVSGHAISRPRAWMWVVNAAAYVVPALAAAAITVLVYHLITRPVVLASIVALSVVLPGAILWLNYDRMHERVWGHVYRGEADPTTYFAGYADRQRAAPAVSGMVFIPAGPFVHGSIDADQRAPRVLAFEGDEQPVRSRFLSAYYIDRHEVTNESFSAFVEATDYLTDAERIENASRRWTMDGWKAGEGLSWREPFFPGDTIAERADHPVVQVSWNDASAFCTWRGARLPTEAEWEKAARGPQGVRFPWGDTFDPSAVNYCDRKCDFLPHGDDSHDDGYVYTAPVTAFPQGQSPYGVMNMAGNVWEWVEDYYDPYYYYYAPGVDPQGPIRPRIDERIVRGGSFAMEPGYLRGASRSVDPVWQSFFGVGFRCARNG